MPNLLTQLFGLKTGTATSIPSFFKFEFAPKSSGNQKLVFRDAQVSKGEQYEKNKRSADRTLCMHGLPAPADGLLDKAYGADRFPAG